MHLWIFSTFWLLWIILMWKLMCWYESLLLILSGRHLKVKLLDYKIILCLTFWETSKLFHDCLRILHYYQQCARVPVSLHRSKSCYFLFFFFLVCLIIAILMGVNRYLIVILICMSLRVLWNIFFVCVSLEIFLFKPFAHWFLFLLLLKKKKVTLKSYLKTLMAFFFFWSFRLFKGCCHSIWKFPG